MIQQGTGEIPWKLFKNPMNTVLCPTCEFESPSEFRFCGHCGYNLAEHLSAPSILVVDDEPYIMQLLQHLFELEGYEVRVASNVKEALAQIACEVPSVVITDMMMPEINGNQFIEMLKKDPQTRRVKIIALTVLDAFDEIRKTVLLGADDYICKPFDPQELLWSVQRVLGRFHSFKEQREKALD